MLRLSQVSKRYGPEPILDKISFLINPGERVGLIGPNGAGKTTLLRLITGLEPPDQGSINLSPPELVVGYLPQALEFGDQETVAEVLQRFTAEHSQARLEMQHCAELMAQPAAAERLADLTARYAAAEQRFEAAGGYELDIRLEAVLTGLGLAETPRELPVAQLSGGEKTRLGLAGLLIQQPRLLVLDEPTNHLDTEALAWLEDWLLRYEGAILVVSHDRVFLDAVTTRSLVLEPGTQTLRDFPGNYSFYLETLEREREQRWQAHQDQQIEIARLSSAAARLRGQAKFRVGGKADDRDKFAKAFFANRSAGTIGRAKHLEQRLERLLTEEKIDKPGRQWQLKLDFAGDSSGPRQVLALEAVSMAFGDQPLFENVSVVLTHGQRVALVGPNGAGKTTLLRLITADLIPTSGRVQLGPGVKVGYLAQEQEILDPALNPFETIQAVVEGLSQTEIRTFLHAFLFSGDEVFIRNGDLSFGERTRLMLALLIAQGCNLLVMDEPTNHLDLPSRERFEQALSQFPGTVLAAVHDRAFIRQVATEIWELRAGGLSRRTGFD